MRLITYIEVKWMTKMVKAYEGEYGSIHHKVLTLFVKYYNVF